MADEGGYFQRPLFDLADLWGESESEEETTSGSCCAARDPGTSQESLLPQSKGLLPVCWSKLKQCLLSLFPFVRIMGNYDVIRDLPCDVISGLTVGIMHIPQGMAYGQLAKLPPVYGLYVSFFATIFYFFLGTSRHNSLGTFAIASLLIGKAINRGHCDSDVKTYDVTYTSNVTYQRINAGNDHDVLLCKIAIATAVTFVTGAYQFIMGVFRLGILTSLMSEPLSRAFVTGATFRVFNTQIGEVVGLTLDTENPTPFHFINTYIQLVMKIHKTNILVLVMCLITMVIMILVKEFINPIMKEKVKMPLPIELIMIIFGTSISYIGHFEHRYSMKVVGDIPSGLPIPQSPPFWEMTSVLGDAVSLALVTFAISFSMGNIFAKKHDYKLDANQELIALGVTNMASSCFSCYVSAASLSRSLVQEAVGGKTQVAGLVAAVMLALVLFAVGPLFSSLPNSVWLVTFTATLLLDVDIGLLVGVVFNIFVLFFTRCQLSSFYKSCCTWKERKRKGKL